MNQISSAQTMHPRAPVLVRLPAALPRTGSLAAWALALLIIAIAALVKPPLELAAGGALPPYITFYPVVVATALLGGPRVGIASALTTLLIAWFFFMEPRGFFVIPSTQIGVTLAVYALIASFLGWIVGHARLALDAARASEAQRAHAARESIHRIKNLLAVVQAISRKVEREVETPKQFREVLSARLTALDIAQGMLVQRNWTDVRVADIIASAMAPFLPNPGLHLEPGPDVRAPARHVGGLCMALYELCTNAVKYGALADGRGPVNLTWREERGDVLLEWRETPPTPPEQREGFGTQLIRNALSGEPQTKVDYVVAPSEVCAVFRWPAA